MKDWGVFNFLPSVGGTRPSQPGLSAVDPPEAHSTGSSTSNGPIKSANYVPADAPTTDAASPESQHFCPPDPHQPALETSPRPVQVQADGRWHQTALPTPTESCLIASGKQGSLANPHVPAHEREERRGLDTFTIPPLVDSFHSRAMGGQTGEVSRTRESRSQSGGIERGAEAALVSEADTGTAMEVDGEEVPRSTVGLRVNTQEQALSTRDA